MNDHSTLIGYLVKVYSGIRTSRSLGIGNKFVLKIVICIREVEERSQMAGAHIPAADGRQSNVYPYRKYYHRTHVSNSSNYFMPCYIANVTIEESPWLFWDY